MHARIVLLNTMLSRSVTRSRTEEAPPEPAFELFQALKQRLDEGIAVEFYGMADEPDEETRIAKGGEDYDRLRLKSIDFKTQAGLRYALLLLEYIHMDRSNFPVVDLKSYAGREISGKVNERGASTVHMLVRLPSALDPDDGTYRCAIESTASITRKEIETFLCRQLRRHAAEHEWTFPVTVPDKKGRAASTKDLRYWPKLELAADVGRALGKVKGQADLSSMLFTKRKERQSTGKPTEASHEDFEADISVRVSARQGPNGKEDRFAWAQSIKDYYEDLGYSAKLFFRYPGGAETGGEVHKSIAGALDLVMCPKETIYLAAPPKTWVDTSDPQIAAEMRKLLDRDELWQRNP